MTYAYKAPAPLAGVKDAETARAWLAGLTKDDAILAAANVNDDAQQARILRALAERIVVKQAAKSRRAERATADDGE